MPGKESLQDVFANALDTALREKLNGVETQEDLNEALQSIDVTSLFIQFLDKTSHNEDGKDSDKFCRIFLPFRCVCPGTGEISRSATQSAPTQPPVWRGYSKYGSNGPLYHPHRALR